MLRKLDDSKGVAIGELEIRLQWTLNYDILYYRYLDTKFAETWANQWVPLGPSPHITDAWKKASPKRPGSDSSVG